MQERVVITGMGAVTPIGIGVDAYWRSLLQGKCGVGHITRFDTEHLPVKIGAEVRDFRAEDFLPRKLIRETDLFTQFALAAAREAVQEGNPVGDAERMGVSMGTAVGGIATIAESQERLCRTGSTRISPYFMPRILGNVTASQIAIAHGFKGPDLTVSTACSAGADAIGMAAVLLQRGEADVMLAVGAESILCPLVIAGLHAARALSTRNDLPEKASRPFDRQRDGMVIGEGAGALLLETLSHARKRGARIRAELISYANCGDAYHITAPEPGGRGEILCMQKALARAGLKPEEIDYINAHGTSTQLGDRVETLAIKAVFGSLATKIPVSSTKGATGHLMGAGGVTELIACVKVIEEGIVPPTINYEEPDPECDLDYVPNRPRRLNVHTAMSNSFGFGGQNTCLVIRRYN